MLISIKRSKFRGTFKEGTTPAVELTGPREPLAVEYSSDYAISIGQHAQAFANNNIAIGRGSYIFDRTITDKGYSDDTITAAAMAMHAAQEAQQNYATIITPKRRMGIKQLYNQLRDSIRR